jgi:hypothetical protein
LQLLEDRGVGRAVLGIELIALFVPVQLANVVEDCGSHLHIGASERLLGDPRLCGDGGE